MTVAVSPPRVLPDLAAEMRKMQAQLEALAAENAKLREARPAQGLLFKRSPEKGAVMVIGVGKRPAILYASQWLRILDKADELRSWIEANRSSLAWKE